MDLVMTVLNAALNTASIFLMLYTLEVLRVVRRDQLDQHKMMEDFDKAVSQRQEMDDLMEWEES